MRREVYIIIKENPETYSVVPLAGDVTIANICQPPKFFLGISLSHDELSDQPELPLLRLDMIGSKARPIEKPQAEDRLVGILSTRKDADCSILRDCTLKQALALCETYDTAPASADQ